MAQTLFRGPVLQGKFNEAGLTGFNLEEKTANYTVADADTGKTFTSKTKDVVFTLPAITIGRVFTFVNTAADGILYAGDLTDNKDIINTQATSKVGDFIVCASLNSTAFWTVVDVQGVFAKES